MKKDEYKSKLIKLLGDRPNQVVSEVQIFEYVQDRAKVFKEVIPPFKDIDIIEIQSILSLVLRDLIISNALNIDAPKPLNQYKISNN